MNENNQVRTPEKDGSHLRQTLGQKVHTKQNDDRSRAEKHKGVKINNSHLGESSKNLLYADLLAA